ncbi:esiB [Symbiodinium sp. CCMP2592]|nr:esiB [Symbiodinium sp. CCMP2592]
MSCTMSSMVLLTSLWLIVSHHHVLGLRRGTEKDARGSLMEPDPSRCKEELALLKRKIQDSCEEDQRNGETVSDGGCEVEAEAVVSDGDYEVWSQSLVKCGPEKTHLVLWSGYQDAEREEVLRPLRQEGGCVLQSQENSDTRLGQLLNAPGVNTLKSCSFPKVKAFWVGASRQFASTWAARSQRVSVAIGYHMQQGRSYKTLFDTVFYRSELKAAVQAIRDKLRVSILFTHPGMTPHDMHAATSVIYERARLLSPVPEKFQKTTMFHYGSCTEENLASCQPPSVLDPEHATFFSHLAFMYYQGWGVARDIQKARRLMELGMEGGDAIATTALGLLYEIGQGVDQNFHKAKELYEIGIKKGDVSAFSRLGYLYETGKGVIQDLRKAKELYETGIENGDEHARTSLGMLYENGQGVAQDFHKAKELYEIGMKNGDDLALARLGFLYETGQGVVQDLRKAKDIFAAGVERGSTSAKTCLGHLYQHGLGVTRDVQKARELFELAMNEGDDDAPFFLGTLYQFGQGVARDFHRAKELYELGIERGNADALASLGYMYYHGLGVARDFQKARELFEPSLERGCPRAATSLGILYENGQGVARDVHKAKELYEIGMKSGDDLAPELLGHLYRDGLAVDQDWDKAKDMYELGISKGSTEAATGLGAEDLYELAVARGSTSAMWHLALLYKNDLNSDELACQWIVKAKEAEEWEAADKLAEWHC